MKASKDSCQLRTNMKMSVPAARTVERRNTLTLEVMDDPTSVVSLPKRLVISPVLVVSKNPISWSNKESINRTRSLTFTRAPTMVKIAPRHPPKIPPRIAVMVNNSMLLTNPGIPATS